LAGFDFKSASNLKYKTFISQEMLKKGILAANSIYVCLKHNEEVLNIYFDEIEKIFKKISLCEQDRLNINDLIIGEVCHADFKRLN